MLPGFSMALLQKHSFGAFMCRSKTYSNPSENEWQHMGLEQCEDKEILTEISLCVELH